MTADGWNSEPDEGKFCSTCHHDWSEHRVGRSCQHRMDARHTCPCIRFVAQPPFDVARLARALIDSDLIRRYSEYATQAGVPKEPVEVLANAWAHHIAVAYYGQITNG